MHPATLIVAAIGPLTAFEFFGLVAALPVFIAFAGVWWLARRLDNYSIVDPAWALSLSWPILITMVTFWSHSHPPRMILFGTMGLLWSLRLGSYLTARVARMHPREDVRYEVLRQKWNDRRAFNFFVFFQAQALLVVLLFIPFAIGMTNMRQQLGGLEWLGVGVWLIGFVGEATADWQMQKFKSDPENRGKVCTAGLWRYSRHPNYFFESVTWWGFWLFACGSPWGWVTIYAPLLMLHFLLRVTGIPLTERCAVESKGDAYRHYQRTTSAFVPWFPKANATAP